MIRAMLAVPLRGVRRATTWWSIGLAALVAVTIAFWPAFRGSSGISEAIDQLPGGVVQAFGLQDFGTPAGFLRGNLYELIVPLLLIAAAISLVAGQTAGDESGGRLELFLAQPVDRGAIFLGRAVAALVALAVASAVVLVAQFVTAAIVGLQIDAGLVTATVVLCSLLAALHGALAFVLAATTGRPGLVMGASVGVAIAGYAVSALFQLSDVLAPWRQVSPWNWALGGDPLVHPSEAWRYLALGVPTVVLLLLGAWLVRRRDVPAP